jgi:diguanylate cyclase (GGDEF)-like protein
MPVRLGLASPRVATKLYATVALLLGMVYALFAISVQFAKHTEATIQTFRQREIAGLELIARLTIRQEQHRRLVATAPAAGADRLEQDEKAFRDLTAAIAALIDEIAPGEAEGLAQRFALLAAQGAAVFDLARSGQREAASAAAARHASAADGLALQVLTHAQNRSGGADRTLAELAAQASSLATRGSIIAIMTGLLIGPMALLFMSHALSRLRGIGSALGRLARNDTSVEIPGTGDVDEFGHLARSVAVFKARSIELINRNGDFERLNQQLDAAINHMPLGLSMFDAQQRLLVCNRRYAEMYDVPAELTERGTAHCALWEHRSRKGARHSETREGAVNGPISSPSMLIEFGSGRIVSVSRQPLKGGGWVSLHEDVTERRRQEAKITHLARHDALTGLANRVLFREQLETGLQRLTRGHGFAVLCLDLDHFKAVNDTLGHPVGDALLKQVSQRLLACVRHGDLVARLGGDEFAIIQASVRDARQTESLAARIVDTICAPFQIDGNPIAIGTSIGITLAPRDGADPEALLRNADLALYRAKDAGRGGYALFETEMHEQVESRRGLETDLRRALAEESLELLYQPVVGLGSDQVASLEAQVRWNHPERGPIPNEELIAVAEEAGLMHELGEWVLQKACAQAAHWPEHVSVSIDVAGHQFLKRNLIEGTLQALAQSGLAPGRLEIEIGEAVLQQESTGALPMLHQLRQLGVRVAIDDFGRDACSLAILRAFPFDRIKLDRAFIAEAQRSDGARTIAQSVIALGKSLGMTTAALGIESFEQLAIVRSCGCDQAQGFLLGPPVPAAQVGELLAERNAAALLRPVRSGLQINQASFETALPQASSQAA